MSDQEYVTVGNLLRNRRVELGLPLEEIAEKTRIQVDLLTALEEDRFDALPGETYLYGFIRSYAESLSLAPDAVVAQLRAQLGDGEQEPDPSAEESGEVAQDAGPRSRKGTLFLLVVALGVIVFATVFRPGGTGGPDPVSVGRGTEPGSEIYKPVVNAEPELAPPEKVSHLAIVPKEGALFRLTASESVSIQLEVDRGMKQDYVLPPDIALSWRVEKALRLRTDKPAALQLWLDGESLDTAEAITLELGPADLVAAEGQ